MQSKKNEAIKRELERIRKANGGRLTKKAVVADARRNKKGVLHSLFDWDVERAAERHWLDRAGEIITRYVTVVVTHKARRIKAVFYVADPRSPPNEGGHIALEQEDIVRADAIKIVETEIGRCESSIERARDIADVLDKRFPGMSAKLQEMLEQIIALRVILKTAA